MKNFKHHNLLSIFGVCLEISDNVPFIVLHYMANGDLRNYLKSSRREELNVVQFPVVSVYGVYNCTNCCSVMY